MTTPTHTDPAATQPAENSPAETPAASREHRLRNAVQTLHREETGASTAEYGIVMLAAVAFAGLLTVVLTSDAVSGLLQGLIEQALGQ